MDQSEPMDRTCLCFVGVGSGMYDLHVQACQTHEQRGLPAVLCSCHSTLGAQVNYFRQSLLGMRPGSKGHYIVQHCISVQVKARGNGADLLRPEGALCVNVCHLHATL